MAYLSFNEIDTGSQVSSGPQSDVSEPLERPRFSALEWSVIALAERDTLTTLRQPGRISAALGTLFGERPNPKLADPKLEALRRLAVLVRYHGYRVAESAIRAFMAAGYSLDQFELLAGSVTRIAERRIARKFA